MSSSTAPPEKGGHVIDSGHWIALSGGMVMLSVVGLSSFAAAAPWWTEKIDDAKTKAEMEVTLWHRNSRVEVAAEKLDCSVSCDQTKIGAAKVRDFSQTWGDACKEATGETASLCEKLWVVRVSALLCWFFALLFCAANFLTYFGAGKPASLRCTAGSSMGLSIGCLLTAVIAIGIAAAMDIRLPAATPGTQPKHVNDPTRGATIKMKLNGLGFWSILISMLCSLLAIAISWVQQKVIVHITPKPDVEERPLGASYADVRKFEPPKVVRKIPWKTVQVQVMPKKPPPKPLGAWQ